MTNISCEGGICRVNDNRPVISIEKHKNRCIIYVGDPMCSWCYGVAPVVNGLQNYCSEQNITFDIVVGGLRSGGDEQWNDQFKLFLKKEWQSIKRVTGQPFEFKLLDHDYFDYDTEPACRAIVTAKILLPIDNQQSLCAFFHSVQKKFYVDNDDPKKVGFYQSICKAHGIDFMNFQLNFESDDTKSLTLEEFKKCRELNVRGFPSFVMIQEGKVTLLASGYTTLAELIKRINK